MRDEERRNDSRIFMSDTDARCDRSEYVLWARVSEGLVRVSKGWVTVRLGLG